MKYLFIGLLFCGFVGVAAADEPYITKGLNEGIKQYDDKVSLSIFYNTCLQTCTSSENRDCPDKCKKVAQDKVKEQEIKMNQ